MNELNITLKTNEELKKQRIEVNGNVNKLKEENKELYMNFIKIKEDSNS